MEQKHKERILISILLIGFLSLISSIVFLACDTFYRYPALLVVILGVSACLFIFSLVVSFMKYIFAVFKESKKQLRGCPDQTL